MGKTRLGNIEIKKTPQGHLIEKNGNSLLIRNNDSSVLLKALAGAINENDIEFITGLLPESFMSEQRYYGDGKNKINKRITFISDLPAFSSKFKTILNSDRIMQMEFRQFGDENLFSKKMDAIVAFHQLPHNDFFLQLNRFCLDNNIQFIKAMVDNFKFIITPFLLPYESACYNCYCLLKARNCIFDRDTLGPDDFIHCADSPLPDHMLNLCAGLLEAALVKFLTTEQFLREDLSEIVLNVNSLETSKNPLLKVPFCEACRQKIEIP